MQPSNTTLRTHCVGSESIGNHQPFTTRHLVTRQQQQSAANTERMKSVTTSVDRCVANDMWPGMACL